MWNIPLFKLVCTYIGILVTKCGNLYRKLLKADFVKRDFRFFDYSPLKSANQAKIFPEATFLVKFLISKWVGDAEKDLLYLCIWFLLCAQTKRRCSVAKILLSSCFAKWKLAELIQASRTFWGMLGLTLNWLNCFIQSSFPFQMFWLLGNPSGDWKLTHNSYTMKLVNMSGYLAQIHFFFHSAQLGKAIGHYYCI